MQIPPNTKSGSPNWLMLVLFSPVLIIVFAVIILLVIPYLALSEATAKIRSIIYCAIHSGRIIFVVDGQNGWRELVQNNLISAIPPDVEPLWFDSPASSRFKAKILRYVNCQRPYLLMLTARGPKALSIHEDLLPFKAHGKRDASVQAETRKVLNRSIERLRRGDC